MKLVDCIIRYIELSPWCSIYIHIVFCAQRCVDGTMT